MEHKNAKSFRLIKKTISVLTLQFFIISNITFAAPPLEKASFAPQNEAENAKLAAPSRLNRIIKSLDENIDAPFTTEKSPWGANFREEFATHLVKSYLVASADTPLDTIKANLLQRLGEVWDRENLDRNKPFFRYLTKFVTDNFDRIYAQAKVAPDDNDCFPITVAFDRGNTKMKAVELRLPDEILTGLTEEEESKLKSSLLAQIYSDINIYNAKGIHVYSKPGRQIPPQEKTNLDQFIDRLISAIMNHIDERFHIIQSMARLHFGQLVKREETPIQDIKFKVIYEKDAGRVQAIEEKIRETDDATRKLIAEIKAGKELLHDLKRPKANVVGFDVGGSNVRVGAYNEKGEFVFLKDHRVEIRGFEKAEQVIELMKNLTRLAQVAITMSLVPDDVKKSIWFDALRHWLTETELNEHAVMGNIEHFVGEATQTLANHGIKMVETQGIGISWPDIIIDNKIVGGDTNKTENFAQRHTEERDERIIGKYDSEIVAREILQLYALKLAGMAINRDRKLVQFRKGASFVWSGYSPPTNEALLLKRIREAAAELKTLGKEPYLLDERVKDEDKNPLKIEPEGLKTVEALRGAFKHHSVIKDAEEVLKLLEAALGKVAISIEGTSMTREDIDQLYERLFRFREDKTRKSWVRKDGRKHSIVWLRGGRGSAGIDSSKVREFTDGAMRIIFIPGANDDGRSWLLFSLLFGFPGAPDFGKSLLDLAQNKEVFNILSTRLNSVEDMESASKDIVGFMCRNLKDADPKKAGWINWGKANQSTVRVIEKCIGLFLANLERLVEEKDIIFIREKSAEILGRLSRDLDSEKWFVYSKGFLTRIKQDGVLPEKNLGTLDGLFGKYAQTPEEIDRNAKEITEGVIRLLSNCDEKTQRNFLKSLIYANAKFEGFGPPLRSAVIVGAWIEQKDVQKALDTVAGLLRVREGDRVITPTIGRHFLNVVMTDGTVFNNEDSINEAYKRGEYYLVIPTERPLTLDEVNTLSEIRNTFVEEWKKLRGDKLKDMTATEKEHDKRVFLESKGVANAIVSKIEDFFAAKVVIHYLEKPDIYPDAEMETQNADMIVRTPTTMMSNNFTTLHTLGSVFAANEKALKVVVLNSFLENEPPGTTGATTVENYVRMTFRRQRHTRQGITPDDAERVIDYVLGRSRDHFPGEGSVLTYMVHDAAEINKLGVPAILSDIEAVEWTARDYVDLYEDESYWDEFAKLRNLDYELNTEFGCPVLIGNDGDVAAFGAAVISGEPNVAALTMGTSLGGGIGLTALGSEDYLAYFSRVIKDPDAEGRHRATLVKGTYSLYLSQAGAIREAEKMGIEGIFEFGKNDRGKLEYLQRLAARNDKRIINIFRTIGIDLGELVVRLYGKFEVEDVRTFVLFGALTEEPKTREAMRKAALGVINKKNLGKKIKIKFAYELEDSTISKNLRLIGREDAKKLSKTERDRLIASLTQEFAQTRDAARLGYWAHKIVGATGAYVFDYSGTLATHNEPISKKVAAKLVELMRKRVDVVILTSKAMEELSEYGIQIIEPIKAILVEKGYTEQEAMKLIEKRLILYLSKGREEYRVSEGRLVLMRIEPINNNDVEKIIRALNLYPFGHKKEIKIFKSDGKVTKIRIHPFGEEKTQKKKRDAITRELKVMLENAGLGKLIFLESSGDTSIDIVAGTGDYVDPGIKRILRVGYKKVIFFGDDPDGDDRDEFVLASTLKQLQAVEVKGVADTLKKIDEQIAREEANNQTQRQYTGGGMTPYQVAKMATEDGKPVDAARSVFGGQYFPSQMPGMVIDVTNILLDELGKEGIDLLTQFCQEVTSEAGKLEGQYREEARKLSLIAGQGLNIISWIKRGIPGAERMRLTMQEEDMVKGPAKYGPSFLDKDTMPTLQALAKDKEGRDVPTEGAPGMLARGAEDIGKLGSANVSEEAVFNKERYNRAKDIFYMYVMVHGWLGVPEAILAMTDTKEVSTIHETAFTATFLPGSIQYTSTGPGHFQGTKLDIKYVTDGEGIQYNKFYDEEGKLVAVFPHRLKPGSWTVALPGAVDSMENLGGLRFNDISVEVSPEVANAILKSLGLKLDFAKIMSGKGKIEKAKDTTPYFAVYHKDKPALVRNVNVKDKHKVGWLAGISPEIFGNKTLTEFYQGLTPEGISGMLQQIAGAVKLEKPDKAKPLETIESIDKAYIASLEKLSEAIQKSQPLKMIPLFKTGKDGYTWGEPVPISFILELMGAKTEEERNKLAIKYGIPKEEVIGERWIAAGSIDVGTGYNLPVSVLSLFPAETFGPEHVFRFGAKSDITAKVLTSSVPLSLQMHEFDEMIIPLESGTALIGLKESLKADRLIEACLAGKVQDVLYEVNLVPGQPMLVPAYMPHAYEKVKVYEVKAVTPAEDAKGTISFFDRLKYLGMREEWKKLGIGSLSMSREKLAEINPQRLKKDVLTMTPKELSSTKSRLEKAEAMGGLNKVDIAKLTLKPQSTAEKPAVGKPVFEILGATDRFVTAKYRIPWETQIRVDRLMQGRTHSLLVVEGTVELFNAEGRVINTLATGEERVLPASLGEYDLRVVELAKDKTEAVVYTQYQPIGAEEVINAVHTKTLGHFAERLAGKRINFVYPQEALKDGDAKKIKAFLEEAYGLGEAKIIPYSAEIGFSSIKSKDFLDEVGTLTVLVGTQKCYENADLADSFQKTLLENSVKTPALPDQLKPNDRFFNIEIMTAGAALAVVSIVDNKVDIMDIDGLVAIFSQLTQRALGEADIYRLMCYNDVKDILRGLLPEEEVSLSAVVRFIKGLLMTLPAAPRDVQKELERRREILFSV